MLNESETEIGDVVELKSGGPRMTIVGVSRRIIGAATTHPVAECRWFDEYSHLQSSSFDLRLLKLSEGN